MSSLKNTVVKYYLLLLGNSLGIRTNALYSLQHTLSILGSGALTVDANARKKADELKKRGIVVAGKKNVAQMTKIVAAYCAKKKADKNGVIMMDRKASKKLAPYVYEALSGEIEKVLNDYYGSHFQPYWIAAMRYKKANASIKTSFGYHIDDNPKELMKVFFYLNDTYESNAAFRTFDYPTTKELVKQGFNSSTGELRQASQKLITPKLEKQKLKIFEGKKGTALIFDNNLLHKGTSPKRGYRDVVVVEVYPSAKRFDLDSIQKGLVNPFTTDYPANPFVNDVLAA